MPAVPKHRQAIIDTSVRLFRRKGYSATGLNDIVEASGAPKGSLYHYFPAGKASIAEAAVEEAGRRVAETMRKLSLDCATASALIRSHAKQLAGWMKQSGFRDGCPITTVLLELSPLDRTVTDAGRKAYTARIGIMKEKLVADGVQPRRAERLAVLCVAALQGALIQSRVERSGAPILAAADELADLLEAGALD